MKETDFYCCFLAIEVPLYIISADYSLSSSANCTVIAVDRSLTMSMPVEC